MAKSKGFDMEQSLLDKGFTRDEKGNFVPPPKGIKAVISSTSNPFRPDPPPYTGEPCGNVVWGMPDEKTRRLLIQSMDGPVTFQSISPEVSITGHAKPLIVFSVDPIGAPRMTQSDKWKTDPAHADPKRRQRKPVAQYYRFKSAIKSQAAQYGFVLPDSFHAVCVIPMPHSWSNKEKGKMNGARHQQKPDFDNIAKAICDSLLDNDAVVWDCRITKYWGNEGKIFIYPL